MREFRRVRAREQLEAWARLQHRQVTTAQLRAIGWDKDAVKRRVAGGWLHPVFKGVYSLGGPPQGGKEVWMAATLTFGPGTKLSHSSAAELYELLRYPLGQLHVVTTTERKPREGIEPHHRGAAHTWRYVDGIPVMSPEETILDCATMVVNPTAYRRIVRKAQADGLTTHARLLAHAFTSKGRRGVARLARELREGPSPTRSANEDEVLAVFRHGGEPLANHHLDGDEVDLYFPALNVAIEIQSPLHDSPAAQAHDTRKRERLERKGVRVLWLS